LTKRDLLVNGVRCEWDCKRSDLGIARDQILERVLKRGSGTIYDLPLDVVGHDDLRRFSWFEIVKIVKSCMRYRSFIIAKKPYNDSSRRRIQARYAASRRVVHHERLLTSRQGDVRLR